jgi:hypothetical protein
MKKNDTEITVNDVVYVRKDSISKVAESLDGMQPVLIRSYAAGVHFGYLKSQEHTLAGTLVTLVNTRRVYSWQGAATLSQMALEGVKSPSNCKFSVVLPENTIQNCIEVIPVSESAWECLNNVPVWKM